MLHSQSRLPKLALGLAFLGLAGAVTATPAHALNQNINFTAVNGGFTPSTGSAADFTWGSGAGWSTAGANNLNITLTSPSYSVTTAGNLLIGFTHQYNTESCCDFGQLFVSRNGGGYTQVSAFTTGGGPSNNGVWNGISGGLISSAANLGAYALGETVRFQFLYRTDVSVVGANPNWRITQFSASTSATPVPFVFSPLPGLILGWGAWRGKRKLQQRQLAAKTV